MSAETENSALRTELAWAVATIDRLVGESLTKLNARGRARLAEADTLAFGAEDHMRQSYEQKIDDLRRETLRSSIRGDVIRRLFSTVMAEARGNWSERATADYFERGFPSEEMVALIEVFALTDPETSAWLADFAARGSVAASKERTADSQGIATKETT